MHLVKPREIQNCAYVTAVSAIGNNDSTAAEEEVPNLLAPQFKVFSPVPVVDEKNILIQEYFGNVASQQPALSACVVTIKVPIYPKMCGCVESLMRNTNTSARVHMKTRRRVVRLFSDLLSPSESVSGSASLPLYVWYPSASQHSIYFAE